MEQVSQVEAGILRAVSFINNHKDLISNCKENLETIDTSKLDIVKYSNTIFKKIKVNIFVRNILKDKTVKAASNKRIVNPSSTEYLEFNFIKSLTDENFSNSSLSKSIYPRTVNLNIARTELGQKLMEFTMNSSSLIGFHNQLVVEDKNIYTLLCLSFFEDNNPLDTLNYATKTLRAIDKDPQLRKVFKLDPGSVFRLKEYLSSDIFKGRYSDILNKEEKITSILGNLPIIEDSSTIKIEQRT